MSNQILFAQDTDTHINLIHGNDSNMKELVKNLNNIPNL